MISTICPVCGKPVDENEFEVMPGALADDRTYHGPCMVRRMITMASTANGISQEACRLKADLRVAVLERSIVRRQRNSWMWMAFVAFTIAAAALLMAGWYKLRCGL